MRKETQAQRAVRIINNLTHTKGSFAGQSFDLRPWQKKIVQQLFKTRKDGLRQFRTCLLMLPRKNGKSEIAAALAIYFLLFDGEMGAEVYSAAADKDQAALVFNVAAQMIRNDPELLEQCEIADSQKRIVHRKSGSFYRAISAEAYSKHGFNASVVIYDELHAAPNRELWDVLSTSQGARSQPLMIAITTAGYDRHSILYELYAHAKKVLLDPSLDPTFLPILFEVPKEADWLDESVWRKANPALGDFRSLEEMRIAAQRAKSIPAQENTFRRLYLNQWTEQAERWMPMALWKACEQSIDWQDYEGRTCYVGMDLSSTRDVTAIVAVFPEDDDGAFAVLPCCFVPRDSMRERARKDGEHWNLWEKSGLLEVTTGNVVDYEAVRRKLREWSERFGLRMLGFDPWNATDLVNRLTEQDGLNCVPVRQGYATLTSPTKALTDAIVSKRLTHDGHPVLTDHILNAAAETDGAGNLKLSKKESGDRIDAAAALVSAVYVMQRNAGEADSAYSDHGLMVV